MRLCSDNTTGGESRTLPLQEALALAFAPPWEMVSKKICLDIGADGNIPRSRLCILL